MEETKTPKQEKKPSGKIAAILIRGTVQTSTMVEDTLTMLRLRKKNTCVVIEDTPAMRGMINKVKDLVTYGEIDDETFKLMQEKRGQKDQDGNYKKHYHLSPPRGGFERKGIKRTYDQGGALSNRGKEINALIKRMI